MLCPSQSLDGLVLYPSQTLDGLVLCPSQSLDEVTLGQHRVSITLTEYERLL